MLTVLMWLLFILFTLPILILSLALRYSINASIQDSAYLHVYCSWSGLVHASYRLDKGPQVKVLGFPINILSPKAKDSKKEQKKKVDKAEKAKKSRSKGKFPLTIRQTLRLVRQLLSYLRPHTLRADLTVGFDDPYYTGLLSALVSMMQWSSGEVRIVPNFTETVVSGSFLMEGRVRPIALVIIALRTFVPVFLENIKNRFKRKKEETENVRI